MSDLLKRRMQAMMNGLGLQDASVVEEALQQIEELEARLDAVRDCQTYVVELDDCEIAWFKKDDVLKAIGEDDE